MNTKPNDKTLVAYLNGELEDSEKQQVEEWMFSSEENKKQIEQLYYIMFVSDRISVINNINVDQSLDKLKKQIREKERKTNKRPPFYYMKRVAVAAIFIGLLLTGNIFYKHISESLSAPYSITTGLGERAQTTLPDGTRIWVGACSKLEYYTPLLSKERKVNLTGEAYFEVKNKNNAPFIVNSNEMRTEVLGTKFNIRANSDEQFIVATLLEGSIRISSIDKSEKDVIMKPMHQLLFDRTTGDSRLYTCSAAEEYIGWINGNLHFDRTSLENIAISLERYYNVDIVINSENLKKEIFTCDFDTKENIYQILSVLKMTNKFDYKVNNRTIEIIEKK